MSENRRPLSDLVAYAEQIVDATGRLQDFRAFPFFYIIIGSDTGRSALHIRAIQTEPLRTIGLGEGWVNEPFRTIRMYVDGLPVALDDFNQQTPYRIERYAHNWIKWLEEKGYLQQAALFYTAMLSPESPVWCPLPKDAYVPWQQNPVSEQHYCRRLQPQEGILLHERSGPQAVASVVKEQYLEQLDAFSRHSQWFDTAIVRATVAARFRGFYYVVLSPVECYTTWDNDPLSLPVSAFLFPVPHLLTEDGLLLAAYTNEQGAIFVSSEVRALAGRELRKAVFEMVRSKDLHFLYCPNCGRRVAKSTEPPPYNCTRCAWKQEAWR